MAVDIDVESQREYEASGEVGGHTHVTLAELKGSPWSKFGVSKQDFDNSEWRVVFELMKLLEPQFDDLRVRIVTWWNW